VSGVEKVVKIRPKHFSAVLTRNDNNFTLKSVGMFPVPNVVILAWFSTVVAPVERGTEKVIKIRPNHF